MPKQVNSTVKNSSPICLRFSQVIEMTGLSRSTINRHRVSGAFPEPLRVGGVLLWRQADLIEWLDNLSSNKGGV